MQGSGSLSEWERLESSEMTKLAHQEKLRIKERRGQTVAQNSWLSEKKDMSHLVQVGNK